MIDMSASFPAAVRAGAAAATVFVVDDDDSLRRALGRVLRGPGWGVEGFGSAEAFLERLPFRGVGCVLLDVNMPGLSGPELQARLLSEGSTLPVVFLTGHGDIPTGIGAMKRGAIDFLTKPVDDETLLRTVAQAIEAHAQRGAHDRELGEAQQRLERLSPREREVMELVVAGLLNKQIADHMEISIKTVKVHRSRVMEKMEVRSVAALVHLCELAGITLPAEAPRR
jgi:RNA polymerase sigma factor (sigma-70 family)